MTDRIITLTLTVFILTMSAWAQSPSLMKRTTTKTDRLEFGAGGSVSITGAPKGSITVIGTSKNEIEITAEIEVEAANEADLARLSAITTFVTEEGLGRYNVISVGNHNKFGDKKVWKKVPKELRAMPYRIDYVVHVPRYADLVIDGGKGGLSISGVDGMIRINFLDAESAKLDLVGGSVIATFGNGSVDVTVPTRAWRGRSLDIQLASGTMNVLLPGDLNAELDATVLRDGAIDNQFPGLQPRVRKAEFTDHSIIAKAGNGGIPIKLSVGDGTLRLTAH